MPEYLSPGVYVEEIPSTIKPIAGVSTSTPALVGIVRGPVQIPEPNPHFDPTGKSTDPRSRERYRLWTFPYPDQELETARTTFSNLAEPNVRPARARNQTPQGLREFRDAQE